MSLETISTPCIFRWNWPIVDLANMSFQNCCKTPGVAILSSQIEGLGTDLFLNSPEVTASRLNLVNGIQDEGCNHCWRLENLGIASPRIAWKGSALFTESRIGKSIKYSGQVPIRLQVVLGNTCNLECIYCGPERSTRWQTRLKMKVQKDPLSTKFANLFWKWFSEIAPNIDEISLTGGEPLLSPNFADAIKRIHRAAENRSNPIWISLISNLSFSPNLFDSRILELTPLSGISKMMIEFSNEAIGARGEYIRWGLSWSNFNQNLETLAKNRVGIMLGAQIATNCLSISTIDQYVNYLFDLMEKFSVEIFPIVNYVNSPAHLDPIILPASFSRNIHRARQAIALRKPVAGSSTQAWEAYDLFLESIEKQLELGRPADQHQETLRLRGEFKKYIEWLDLERKTSFIQIFPEMRDFYDSIPTEM